MKKRNLIIAMGAFTALSVLNFEQTEKRFALSRALASSSSGSNCSSSGSNCSSSTPSNSSSNSNDADNPCCNKWTFWKSCNKKKLTSQTRIECRIIRTTYVGAGGELRTEINEFGVITQKVSAGFKAKAINSYTEEENHDFDSEVVTCPTNGKCNDCEEYRPECHA